MFAISKKVSTFAIPTLSNKVFAEIAQLVERNLAKVEVAGPSPVFRSTNKSDTVRFLTYFFVSVSELRDLNPPPRGRRPQPLFVRVDSAFSDDALRHDFHHLAVRRGVSFILFSDHIL